MEILGFKRVSYGAIFALAVVLFLIIAGAMFFADEVDDFFDHSAPKTTQVMELRGDWLGMKLTSLDSLTRILFSVVSYDKTPIRPIRRKQFWHTHCSMCGQPLLTEPSHMERGQ